MLERRKGRFDEEKGERERETDKRFSNSILPPFAGSQVRGRGEHGLKVPGQHCGQPVAGQAGVLRIQHGKPGKEEPCAEE